MASARHLSIATTGNTFGHNAGKNTISMAATYWGSAHLGAVPFTGMANPVEPFSSDGPRKIFYNPDGSSITPGNYLFATNGGTTLLKPDIDGGRWRLYQDSWLPAVLRNFGVVSARCWYRSPRGAGTPKLYACAGQDRDDQVRTGQHGRWSRHQWRLRRDHGERRGILRPVPLNYNPRYGPSGPQQAGASRSGFSFVPAEH